jgi:dTDP-3-amino-3,4,6-trideoxy-alpha-D-glucose transaminase
VAVKSTPSGTTAEIPFVDLVAQYGGIRDEIDDAFREVTESAEYILGPRVARFEESFAAFVGARHGVGVGSGLDALRLALLALDVGPGDEVIVPANSYIATALAVSDVGADVVLVDCDVRTYNVDVQAVGAALSPRTRALLPVHFTGQSAEMGPLLQLTRDHELELIEDAAQAHGASWQGRPCGSIGHIACFSFYPGKNLGAYGDGGMVTTSKADVAERIRRLRNYGERRKYDHVVKGVNSRLDGLQAAFLAVKLRHLGEWNAARARHAAAYAAQLDGVGDITLQHVAPDSTHVYHLFIVRTTQRDRLRAWLADRGIQTGIHYPVPIHLQEAYAELGLGAGAFPNAEVLARETLSLPMFPELTDAQLTTVTSAIGEFFTTRVND